MTIQHQQRPKTTTRGSENSTLKKSVLAPTSLLLLSILAATATAEIQFTSPPADSTFAPGATVPLTWSIRPVNGTNPANTDPFDLVLRALSGQRYSIQTAVAQSALTLSVKIPADATGGLVSSCSFFFVTVLCVWAMMMAGKM